MSDLNLTHTVSNDGTILSVTIAGKLAIDTASELHQLLLGKIESIKKIQLDLSALNEIDLSGVQLICSACRTALDNQKHLNFSGCIPPDIKKTISNSGLLRQTTCKHNADHPCIWCGGMN